MRTFIFLIFQFFLGYYSIAQPYYYVDGNNGNDSNNGTSLSTAWKTIQKAANTATSGGAVFIKGGYYFENISINVSGTNGNPIVFRNYQNDTVIIDGTGTSQLSMIEIVNQNYIELRNLTIQNKYANDAAGVIVYSENNVPMTDIVLANLTVRNIGWTNNSNVIPTVNDNAHPILFYGTGAVANSAIQNILVDSCEIYDNISGFSENCTVDGNIDGFIISNNTIYNNTNIGIDAGGNYQASTNTLYDHARNGLIIKNVTFNNVSSYSNSAGIYIDGGWNITIEQNESYANHYGIEIGCEENGTTENIIVKNNLIHYNITTGMHIGGYDINTTGQVLNSTIRNNTFYNNDTGNNGAGEMIFTKFSNCAIENNIFYTNSNNILLYKENINPWNNNTINFNCLFTPNNNPNDIYVGWNGISYTTFNTYQSGTSQEANSIYGNPLFVSLSDFHLQSNSICKDAGNPNTTISSNEKDFYNNSRVYNGIIDIGASEYSSALNVENAGLSKNNLIKLYPNPTKSLVNINLGNEYSNAELTVYNILGEELFYQKLENVTNVDLSKLINGVYILKINNDNRIVNINKIILQK